MELSKQALDDFLEAGAIISRSSIRRLMTYLYLCENHKQFQRKIVEETGLSHSLISQDLKRLVKLGAVDTYRPSGSKSNIISMNIHVWEKYVNSINYVANIKEPKV